MKKMIIRLWLISSGTQSAVDLYIVVVIFFEFLDPAAARAEVWPASPGAPARDKAVDLSALTSSPAAVAAAAPAPERVGWRVLSPAQLTMGGVFQRLRSSARYRPLLHVGWVQPLANADRGAAVDVFNGMMGSNDST